MKWDMKNKQRLKDALFNKALKISGLSLENFVVYGPSGHDEWDLFLDSVGIKKVKRRSLIKRCVKTYTCWEYDSKLARDVSRIILRDSFVFRGADTFYNGLSIPKEVAEKFLVLGVP